MMDNINGIVLSLDITNEKKALSLATKLEPFIDGIKVGYPLILSCGLQIIKQLSRIKPIISDLKIADIPNTNKIICKQIFESGSESIIIHGFTGMDSILACNKIANEYSSYIFIVVEMSHNTGNIYFNDQISESLVRDAKKVGIYGIVAPATRPKQISKFRTIVGKNMKIISPGIGTQGGNAKKCFNAGADWIIIGRSIYNSLNPINEIQKYIK